MNTVELKGQLPVNRSVFGLLAFLATEVMFFAGLISAQMILRAGQTGWPPPDQPRLPVGATAVTTLFLLVSGYTVSKAGRAVRRGEARGLSRWLSLTWILGAVFLGVQGAEWARLIGYGLTMRSSVYGGMFYTLIGGHALHALAGMVVLTVTLLRSRRGRYSTSEPGGVELCRIYWLFVVGIWPFLYVLVYLA